MGEDHVRKTQREYRRLLQKRAEQHLGVLPLLAGTEAVSTKYPCTLLQSDQKLKLGSKLVIFQRTEKATIAVLRENEVVALIEGEAAKDLHQLFKSKPRLCRTLRVKVVSVTDGTSRFEVVPIVRAQRKQR